MPWRDPAGFSLHTHHAPLGMRRFTDSPTTWATNNPGDGLLRPAKAAHSKAEGLVTSSC